MMSTADLMMARFVVERALKSCIRGVVEHLSHIAHAAEHHEHLRTARRKANAPGRILRRYGECSWNMVSTRSGSFASVPPLTGLRLPSCRASPRSRSRGDWMPRLSLARDSSVEPHQNSDLRPLGQHLVDKKNRRCHGRTSQYGGSAPWPSSP